MKTKRSGYLQKGNQVAKRLRRKDQELEASNAESQEKKDQPECNGGVCVVAWKPLAVSR
jgi:hypothetical protein